jgi:hypothetical protein
VHDLRERRKKLNDAYVFQQAISQADYLEMKAGLDVEMATAERELNEAKFVELDVEAVLGYAENVFINAARMWEAMSSDQKQRFQQVLFPEGVQFGADGYRTASNPGSIPGSGETSAQMNKGGILEGG